MMVANGAKKHILISGAAGHLGMLVAESLAEEYEVVGIDSKAMGLRHNFPGEFHRVKLSRRELGDIIASRPFESMIHLGRLRVSSSSSKINRYRENVVGTKSLLNLGLSNGIKNFIVVGSHLVYGPLKDNPFYITEDSPLKGGVLGSEFADLIEMDHEVTNFIWRHRKARTILLRPVHILGAQSDDILVRALSQKVCPYLVGFDPLLQFIDEEDVVKAIKISLSAKFHGVYNLTGEGVVPLSKAIELCDAVPVPVLAPVAGLVRKVVDKLGYNIPPQWTKFIKYSTVIDGTSFRDASGYEPEVSIVESLRKLKKL